MLRDVAILSAAMVVLQVACPSAQGSLAPESRPDGLPQARVKGMPPAGPRHAAPSHVSGAHRIRPSAIPAETHAPIEAVPEPPPALSHQEEKVSQVAARKGDRGFLMVDKTLGKIILFENNRPIFSGPALTGESTADRLPPNALHEKFSRLSVLDNKVTPAGRFTVSRSRDVDYGTVLDINEIHGKDWGIAIHKVYLGIPSEHRDARLHSPSDEDKHITFGCINVTPDTIRFLLRALPAKHATPLYILPADDTKTAAYFAPHNS